MSLKGHSRHFRHPGVSGLSRERSYRKSLVIFDGPTSAPGCPAAPQKRGVGAFPAEPRETGFSVPVSGLYLLAHESRFPETTVKLLGIRLSDTRPNSQATRFLGIRFCESVLS